jgi:oligosaccharide repeat unit polymerase
MSQIAVGGISPRDARRARMRSTVSLVLAAVLALGYLANMATPATALVAYPVVAIIGIVTLFAIVLAHWETGEVPYFEVGFFFVAVVSLYGVYSLVTAITLDLRYTPFSDLRLWMYQPPAAELARAGWMQVYMLGTFTATYLLVRRKTPPVTRVITKTDPVVFVILVGIYLFIKLYFFFLISFFGLRFDSYYDQYLAYRSLPLVFAQVANHLGGMLNTVQLLLLFSLFASYKRNRAIIFTWLIVATALAFLALGSRTELFLLLLSAMIVYHRLVRPLKGKVIVSMAAVALLAFLVMGILRLIRNEGAVGVGNASEFDTLFANSVDLLRRRDLNVLVPPPTLHYFNDLLALIPQQLMPIAKVDLPTWYLRTYYPEMYSSGGGYAFGMVAESIIGAGVPELIVRSAMLGIGLALFHRWFAHKRRATLWTFALYTWVTAISYQSYRNSTFVPLVYLWYRFLPLYLAVILLTPVVRAALFRRVRPGGGLATVST